jgi:transketolase
MATRQRNHRKPEMTEVSSASLANAVRALSIDAVEQAKSGHPGLPLGAADVATVLFTKVLKYNAADPSWPDRDRFVLSAGHGSMLLYALLHLSGEESMTLEEIRNFRQFGSKTPGHPEYGHTAGVEMTTGPLGQGLATSVGFALAERMLAAEFGDVVDHRTYVLASDGDLMEGVSQEAIAIAGHLRLNRLVVLWDDNGISIDGPLSVADSVDQLKRFESAGWAATRVDGHDPAAIFAALEAAQRSDKPTLIACNTVIGFGAPTRAGKSKAHGEPLGAEEMAGTKAALNWPHAPFEVPDDILDAWRAAGARGAKAQAEWQGKVDALEPARRAEFLRRLEGRLPAALAEAVAAEKRRLASVDTAVATRKASEAALKILAPAVPELVTGSADLTGSNNTKVEATPAISPGSYAGRYVHWGVREHGMAAAVNGMTLHGGLIPSGATFLAFADYCRPALRLASLMGIGSIEVLTHDSIGLGEDGPTHQPVEHLASLRAIPGLLVFRPADATETLECWQAALENRTAPSVLALTRQNLAAVRREFVAENLSAKGAYELSPASGPAKVTLFASGSEVEIALDAQKILEGEGVATRVVSVPCFELFLRQSDAAQREVIGSASVRVAVEAGIAMGWDLFLGREGVFVGMSGFGASAPFRKLYEHFGIDSAAVARAARNRLKGL